MDNATAKGRGVHKITLNEKRQGHERQATRVKCDYYKGQKNTKTQERLVL